jgi:hypothetical protein
LAIVKVRLLPVSHKAIKGMSVAMIVVIVMTTVIVVIVTMTK